MKMSGVLCLCLRPTRLTALWLAISLALALFGMPVSAGNNGGPLRASSSTDNSIYGNRYSHSILRGVSLSDVFVYNDQETTLFGPAYANVWTIPSNFLSCKPPTGRKFSYALCYYSGPDGPTGNTPDNPSLPCTLSPDGVVANCSCYEISTDVVSPKIPYYVDIHAISNLEIYEETVKTCGREGERCDSTDKDPPVCEAINTNLLVPGADLISVFSPVYAGNYSTQGQSNSTDCSGANAQLYAGCMTAPCYRTGQTDPNGFEIVECKCPVFNGPFQVGQANQNCDANQTSPNAANPPAAQGAAKGSVHQNTNVWSAAYSPNGGAIQPPAATCVPDQPGTDGCGLYDPNKDYSTIVNPSGALCNRVCDSYGRSITAPTSRVQVGYSCDSTLCTTLGIGQENNPNFPPSRADQIFLASHACEGIQEIDGMKEILLVEGLAECSCCASQVCECDTINRSTNREVYDLDEGQRKASVQPQCDLNNTLCGVAPP